MTRPAYGAESENPRRATAPFSSCPIDVADSDRFFVRGKDIPVNKDYTIKVFRTRTATADLKNVVAVLTKYSQDSDVEIPRVTVIYYDGKPTAVATADNKGDITIPSTAGLTVQVTFCLQGLKKTDWKHSGSDGNESIFVAGPARRSLAS
jgi:hypothetical protein